MTIGAFYKLIDLASAFPFSHTEKSQFFNLVTHLFYHSIHILVRITPMLPLTTWVF
jgi:hypothetical protein